jgi:hypothetical protein
MAQTLIQFGDIAQTKFGIEILIVAGAQGDLAS